MTTANWSLRAAILAAVIYLVVLVWFSMALPDQVPGHFNAAGEVDRYDSKVAFVAMMTSLGVLMIAVFCSARWWMPKIPAKAISLPGKEAHAYWTSPEHRGELNELMAKANEWFGALVLLLLSFVVLASGLVGLGVNVPGWVFWASFGTFFVVMTAGLIPLIRKTRVPAQRR